MSTSDPASDHPACAFCGSTRRDVPLMIAGPPPAAICEVCVDLCVGVVAAHRAAPSRDDRALPTLHGDGLRLRTLTDADVPALFEIFGDPEVTRYFGFEVLRDLTAAASLLADVRAGLADGTLWQWGIEVDARIVGTCTLSSIDAHHRRAELGFALGRAWQGRGIVARAVPLVLTHAFEEAGLHRVYADADPRNHAALRTLDQLGFTREGLLREHHLHAGEAQDGVLFGLLRREWEARSART